MPQKFSNKARSQLLAAISATDTSFSVVATDAGLFPTADVGTGTLPSAPGDWFKAVIEDSNGYEIVYVRTRSAGSNVFSNVLRGQEGTTARSFPAGAIVGLRVTAQDAETAAKVPDLQAQITGLASSKLDVAAPSFGGNAATATRLQTARTINGTSFNGSANITTANWGTARTITIGNTAKSVNGSDNVSWSLDEIGAAGHSILSNGADLNAAVNPGFYRLGATSENSPASVNLGQLIVARGGGDTILQIVTGSADGEIYWRQGNPPNIGGSGSWGPWHRFFHSGNINTANAGTATRLQTARTINGTSFNGSANITTANWGTARTITIGNTAKSVNGSDNVSWSLDEIGAAGHSILSNGADLNAAVNPGFYRLGATSENSPASVNLGQLIVARGGGDTILQIVTGSADGEIYWRQGNPPNIGGSGSWGPWHRFFHSGNINTANAGTATRLQTARTINGTSFNGSANITTANWGTARTITIGNTAKSVNGSDNVSWSLAEIGAVGTTGDQTIGGVKTFSAFPVLPRTLGGFYKADPNLPAFVKTGATTLSIRAQTRIEIAGAWVEFLVDTAVTMPTLTAGEDYAIWALPDGTLQATADPFSSPAAPPVPGARKIGGFHYGLVAPGTTPAGGSFATTGFTNTGGRMQWTQAAVDRIAGINEFSLWDLAWRCKGQQRGMALDPQTEVWHAIYFCSVNHIVNGISRNNTNVASGTVLPRIPIAYGGNGTLNYGRLSQYECEEIAASFGLRLPTPDEFRSAMFGVTEAQSLGGATATIPLTTRQPGYTSRIGIEQATGHMWVFARGNSAAGGSEWIAGPNRGNAFGNAWVILLGGSRDIAANSGSRASRSDLVAWDSRWDTALRAAGDHIKSL